MKNTNQNEPKSHDTSFYSLDTLESEVYSREYKAAMHKASIHKKTGITLLCCGAFLVFLCPLLLFLINKSQCQNDTYGWCGFGFFLSLLPVFFIGIILLVIGIVKTIRAKRILENKKRIRRR